MMLKKSLTVFYIFLVSCTGLFAQGKKQFSTDPKAFAADMKAFFADDKRPESQEVSDKFLKTWEVSLFTPEEQAKIMETTNLMLKERMRTNPEFVSYLNLLNIYKDSKIDLEKFNQYHQAAQKVIDKTKKDLVDFNNNISLLFRDLSLYDENTKKWKVSNQKYIIGYEKEPVVIFPAIELQLYTKGDTLGIYETSGKYYPASQQWVGKGGMVYWTRVGFPKNEAFAKLINYSLNVKESGFSSDSAQFTFPKVFSKPVWGRLEDKAMTTYQGTKASYPRFQSYQTILEIKNIFKNVDYKGGFALEGRQILGTGNDSSRAMVTIKYNGKTTLRAYSRAFVIDPDKIAASKAAVSIYLDKDSVYHSQVIFNYQEGTRLLTLSRNDEGLYASPFFTSYHKLEFRVGNLLWNIDEPLIKMKTIANPDQAAEFESGDFYTEGKYMQIQSILDYNPLKKLRKYVLDNRKMTITEDELAMYFNSKPEYLHNLLFQMANEGYIFYDVEGKKIVVKDKLMHYVTSAEKTSDFDIIEFESVVSAKPNATISLLSYELTLDGVRKIDLSDSQKTFIIPADQKVVVKKNRDMMFSGQVHSGRFDFWGNSFLFDYQKFNVALNNVDSVKFKFPEYDKNGKVVGMRTIQNSLQNVNGFLYIDDPNNKSGRQVFEDYPIFECNKESYVYYDKKHIYNGVYRKDVFFYKINPFTIKRLDDFTAEGLQFPGSFVSADIMPVIQNALTIQEDFSLGFIQASPGAGYPLYKGKGTGKGTFMLSNKGLRATGEVDYLASKIASDNFIFFPDSMNSRSQTFDIPELASGKYPPVAGKDVYNHWAPYKDSLYIYKRSTPLSVYNGKIDFSGSLILTPVELVGTGNMAYQDLEIASKAFAFLPKNIKSNSGDLKIRNPEGNKAALTAKDVVTDIDLTQDFGKFRTNKDTSKVLLPSNRFATTLNNFTYNIKDKKVDFSKSEKQSDEDAYFVSNNPEQEALQFNSKSATYDITRQNIKAKDVPYITIADSRIYTPDKIVQIEKEGNIASIKGAEVVTDFTSKNHKIYNAFINVFSKTKFTGYGDYDYIDKANRKFTFRFSDIHVDETGKTIAKGKISDTAKFYLSPAIRYMGDVNLVSTRKDLAFDGYVLPDHKIAGLRSEWVRISDTLDPKTVIIDVPMPKARDGKDLFTGTFISADSNKIYNLLLGRKHTYNDLQVFATSGVLYYDETKNEFAVGPRNKVVPAESDGAGETSGNIFRMKEADQLVTTEGTYDFGAELKHVNLATAGDYRYSYKDSSDLFSLVMLVDFPIGDEVVKLMLDTLVENSYDLQDNDNSKPSIANAFALLMKDKKDRAKVLQELSTNAYVPVVDELNKAFVFTEVKLSFNDTSNSFVSIGPLSLASVKKTSFDKQVPGVMEIKKQRGGDKFSLILQSSAGSYHYFSYQNNIMSILSSDYAFDDKMTETAPKVEKGQGNFHFKLATVREAYKLVQKGR